jgi:hypothetical protein
MDNITHEWSIIKLIQKNDGMGTVTSVHYNVKSTYKDLSISTDAQVDLPPPTDENNYILYEHLTEEKVLEWTKETLGETLGNHELCNSEWLLKQRPENPETISEPLPWK